MTLFPYPNTILILKLTELPEVDAAPQPHLRRAASRSRSDFYDAAAAAARRRWPAAAAAGSAARAAVRSARLAAVAADFGMLRPPQTPLI